jgi:pimeloyl-CoA dehydrogenase small subunit
MDFQLTDEQRQLRDTLNRFVAKDYAFEKRKEILKSKDGFSRAVWKAFADMGLTAIGLPEAHGGLGGNAVDTQVVMEALGRGMVVEPYLATVVLAAGLIARAGSEPRKAALLPAVVSGDMLLAFAHYEPASRYELAAVTTSAKKGKDGYVLNGAKAVVLHGGAADKLIVSARTSGKPHDEAGLSLFIVERKARGVTAHAYPTHDGHQAADITFKDVAVPADALVGKEGAAFGEIELTVDRGIAALCAEAVGAMGALLETTLAYLKTRKQFGVPIGSFQVLQHRMADMVMQTEQARSMALFAAAKVDARDAAERRRALSAAKAQVGQSARFVGQQAVQLHGGIGVTDELAVGHFFKRLTLINQTFGDADHHLAQVSELILAESAAAAPKARKAG